MKLRHTAFAGAVATSLAFAGAAWADQTITGLVTIVDRTTNEVVIKKDDGGTVGSSAPASVEKFKLREVPESLHAGEKVTISYTESGGVKTATKVTEEKN